VEVLPVIRSSRFDLPLSYDAGAHDLHVGNIVRVPLGSREVLAYVLSDPAINTGARRLRAVVARSAAPAAFSVLGLALAKFIAEYYVCTLGEALSAVVLASGVPRTIDRLMLRSSLRAEDAPTVPPRLLSLIAQEFAAGFSLQTLLRHPDARRTGDRSALLRHVSTLVRNGLLSRSRSFVEPRVNEYRVKVLLPAGGRASGPRIVALLNFVGTQPVPKADALLAGFSAALIARAVKTGALQEEEVAPTHERRHRPHQAPHSATAEQRIALSGLFAAIDKVEFSETLLQGVTGSGKTFVYIACIERVLQRGGRAIVLVPEISLTPQTARRFEDAFGERVAVVHSALSERERYEAWQACARGDVEIVVGARSAVFAPLQNVRLLVVDEAHESSYKQDSSPRYNAVTVARKRMQLEGGVLILGSATPSLESFASATAGRIGHLQLRSRATRQPMPEVSIVDMTEEFASGNRAIFSGRLSQALAERLTRAEKAVLFVNRRGSAGFLLCRKCGFVPQCRRCTVSLAVHGGERILRCHYCDLQEPLPRECPSCGGPIAELGAGTERVAQEVKRFFPDACVVRMDSDTTTRIGDHARLLAEFEARGDVLVGTQMVAKGLDFPEVTLAGVVAADIGLHAAEFRAAERTFGLITQVCGRSGRRTAGVAIVQTYCPEHPAVRFAADHDYDGFARRELDERRALRYPPFSRFAYVGVIGRDRSSVERAVGEYRELLAGVDGLEVLGPAPYPIARVNNEWRYRLALKSQQPSIMRQALRERVLRSARLRHDTRIVVNIDP